MRPRHRLGTRQFLIPRSGPHSRPRSRWLNSIVVACLLLSLLLGAGVVGVPSVAAAGAILTLPTATTADGCQDNALQANDDGSSLQVPLGFPINFFGTEYSGIYVNNNGNVTFNSGLSTYTAEPILTTNRVIIAPFWADVDTRATGTSVVKYGRTTYNGKNAFCVNWVDVGYYNTKSNKINKIQLVLVDQGNKNFDIYMNYDQIQWETGDVSGGTNGLGGHSARVGYSNGSNIAFELDGSGEPGEFLDGSPHGLIKRSINVLTPLGRYLFEVRNGAPPPAGGIQGTVYANSVAPGNVVSGATVQACLGTDCRKAVSGSDGQYAVSGLGAGNYTVTAYGPGSNTQLLPATISPVTVTGTGTTPAVNPILTGRIAIPAGTTITNRVINNGIPLVYWHDPLVLTTQGCVGGTASYQVFFNGAVVRSGPMTESPAGTYSATVASLYPLHGYARVLITITCPGPTTTTIPFDIYIDPSGFVKTVGGTPIAGATVTLYRSDSVGGPFVVVPNGDGAMSPANRTNPDTTDSVGHFGWDVIAGYYKVRASKTGCRSPDVVGQAYVETAALTIPPAVTDLDIRLDCSTPVNLVLSKTGSGSGDISPVAGTYPAGTGLVATLSATAAAGSVFTGWTIDGTLISWASPVTLTMNTAHTVVATFATLPTFGDVAAGASYADPVRQLAARGVINGCDSAAQPPLFCPDGANGQTLRHQMAALIVRAMPGWADETGLPTFTDNTNDAELMRRVATVQRHNVAQGYQNEVCIAQSKTPPCYGPLDTVKFGQTLLFISRAMVNHGYWTLQADDRTLFPDQNGTAGADPNTDRQTLDHRAIVTYVHYAGAPPDVVTTPGTNFKVNGVTNGGWGDSSSRGWFARALWQALQSYFGTDVVP